MKRASDLRLLRLRAGMSGKELARRIHVPWRKLYRYEEGIYIPPVEVIQRIAMVCHQTIRKAA